MTDANLRSIWNFAHKKTMKQFLQPMIEQVERGGGGWMCREDGPPFCVSFSELLYFCVGFFNSPMPFWVDFTNICIFFAVYYVHFIKKSKAQNFRDVQLIPNFLRFPVWL